MGKLIIKLVGLIFLFICCAGCVGALWALRQYGVL